MEFTDFDQMERFAKLMAASGPMVPEHLRGQDGTCLGIIAFAQSFGMDPFKLANKSYLEETRGGDKRIAYEAQVIAAIVEARAPLKQRLDFTYEGEGPERVCIARGEFLDGAVREYRSPMVKDIPGRSALWDYDADRQLVYYCTRAFAQAHCPDVIMGAYSREDMRQFGEAPKPVTKSSRELLSAKDKPQSDEGFAPAIIVDEITTAKETADFKPVAASPKPASESAGNSSSPAPAGGRTRKRRPPAKTGNRQQRRKANNGKA